MTNFEFTLCIIVTLAIFLGFALTLIVIALGSKTTKRAALRLFDLLLTQVRKLLS